MMKNKFTWGIGLLMIGLIVAIFFIFGLSLGMSSQGLVTFGKDTLSAWVSALATVVIASLTIVLAIETWKLRGIQLKQIEQIRKDSIRPSVSLYLKSSPVSFNIIDIHIANDGAGTAQNIKFKFTNKSKDAQEVYDHLQEEFSKLVILSDGISSLGAGEKRTSFLFSFLEISKKFGDKLFEYFAEIDIEFQDMEGKPYTSKSHFKFMEYKGISNFGKDPVHKISSSLEEIQKAITNFSNGSKKLKTDIYTSDDRQKTFEKIRGGSEKLDTGLNE